MPNTSIYTYWKYCFDSSVTPDKLQGGLPLYSGPFYT